MYRNTILYLAFPTILKELAKINICINENLWRNWLTDLISCLPFYCISQEKRFLREILGWKSDCAIFAKGSVIDIWVGSKNTSDDDCFLKKKKILKGVLLKKNTVSWEAASASCQTSMMLLKALTFFDKKVCHVWQVSKYASDDDC